MADLLLKFADDITVKDGVITAILSTEAVDRDGDVVRQSGWNLDNFRKAPRLMSCHDYSSLTKQIGEWRNVRVDPERKALIGEAHYYTGQGNPEADWAYHLASIGQATYSVGFFPAASEPQKAGSGRIYTAQELLECSHVPIPANQEAMQLMQRAFQTRQRRDAPQRGSRMVRKWDSAYMDDDSNGYGPRDVHCIVPGCDDACQINAPVCNEHLKVLMNAPAEPPGSPPDDDELKAAVDGWLAKHRRTLKAGRTISAASLSHIHKAMGEMQALHDGACDDDACPYNDDGSEPPEQRDKGMGEGSGSAGGDVTHPYKGTHTHAHAAGGDQGSDDTHSHAHRHDGDGQHTSAEHMAAHKSPAVIEAKWAWVATQTHYDALSDDARLLLHYDLIGLAEASDALRLKATWDTAFINSLPDSSFAAIEPGGKKDADGKTTPRSLRHYPHHGRQGGDGPVDEPHLKAALSRIGDSSNYQGGKAHLEAHAKAEKIGDYADDKKTFDLGVFEDAVSKALEAAEW